MKIQARTHMAGNTVWVGVITGILTAALVSLAECNASGEATAQGAPPRASSIARVIAPGIVEPFDGDVELAAAESGRVAAILVKEGQRVEKGELLARLEDSIQRAAYESAKSDVAEAQASLDRALAGSTALELSQLEKERDAAAIRARQSQDEYERNTRLADTGSVTQVEMERSQRQAEADAATAAALDARYRNLATGTRKEDIAVAQAHLEGVRGRLAQARSALAQRRVVSPVDGTVLFSRYKPGEYFSPGGESLFVLGNTRKYQIRVDVDEIDVSRVTVGNKAVIRTDQGSATVAEGTVIWVSPKMGRKNLTTETPTARGDIRIREVLVEVPAEDPLLPGLRVWMEVPVGGKQGVQTAPGSAAAF